MYPDRYRLQEVTAHVLALLERRRPGFAAWGPDVVSALEDEARQALAEVKANFKDIADDPGYWERLERSFWSAALPRYLQLAQEQHELQRRKYGMWRGGDLVSRVAYLAGGLALTALVMLTPIPDWMEPVPFTLMLTGPFIPDLQEWWARRRYARRMAELVDDMKAEQQQLETYRPLESEPAAPEPISEPVTDAAAAPRTKERT